MQRIFPLLAVVAILGSFAFAQNASAQNASAQNSGASQSSNKSKPSPIVAKLDQKSSKSDIQKKHSKSGSGANNQSAAYPNKASGRTDAGSSRPTSAVPGSTENAENGPPPKATNNR
jgi:hypothetical protein